MKLHLGCGTKIIKNYINIDIRENLDCDIVDDIKTLSQFNLSSVDEIYACHVLEHFSRHEYITVLKRWFEILKKGGIIKLSVPDLEKVFLQYKNGTSLRELMGFLYGGQSYEHNYHYVGFDYNTLKEDLEQIGFTDVKLWDWRESEHSNIDDFSQAYMPHMDKENGVLMSLNIQAIK